MIVIKIVISTAYFVAILLIAALHEMGRKSDASEVKTDEFVKTIKKCCEERGDEWSYNGQWEDRVLFIRLTCSGLSIIDLAM